MPTDTATSTAEWVTAWGTLTAAIAAVAGLAVSMWTARLARREAREAREALAFATKPTLTAGLGGRIDVSDNPAQVGNGYAWVRNDSRWPATDVQVVVTLSTGKRVTAHADRLGPLVIEPGYERGKGEQLDIEIIPMPANERTGVDTVEVEFSDERRLLRWQFTTRVILTIDGAGQAGRRVEEQERQLA